MPYYSDGSDAFIFTDKEAYTPGEAVFYSLSYKPKSWVSDSEYVEGVDVVLPATPNGFAYECISGGRSHATTEPTFATKNRAKTVDNTVVWRTVPNIFTLRPGDVITNSTWDGLNGEVIDQFSIVDGIQTRFRLTSVALGAKEVTIINTIDVTRLNGDLVTFKTAITIPVIAY